MFQGSITAQIFEDWLEDLIIPTCQRLGLDRVVMDNAPIHHSSKTQELFKDANITLVYLPPYSSILNPIENSLKDLKSWIRRYWRWSEYGYDDYEEFLKEAIIAIGRGEEAQRRARNHIRSCGYEGSF
jgi:transposase